ncbi:hypothetical protein [Enterococcus hirae]|uniref:hypothetical protein n=1 Tax=Enterococcus hirae TaxID=1354 RepID=UPI001369727E|nr:hypothetical protein [Enterococcus hirae]NAE18089.1 hypothetical protein [Enterococcus hirae]
MATHEAAALVAVTPAANADGGAREFLQHLMATGAGVVLPFLGTQHSLTSAQGEQLVIGLVGNGLTYWMAETNTGWRRWTKKVLPVLTGVATAIVPLAVSGGSLSALAGVAGVVPVLHVLAGLANVARPNTLAPAAQTDDGAQVVTALTAVAATFTSSAPVTSSTTTTRPVEDPTLVTGTMPAVDGGYTFGG